MDMSQNWDRSKTKFVVIHHLGDGLGPCKTEEELRRRSQPPGYDYPAYDFGILASGKVVSLRPLTVQGAHCISDRGKYNYGYQWWNRYSVGVVMANSNDRFQPPDYMVDGLICFLVMFCEKQGIGVDSCYPHFQVARTNCPGGKYNKVGLDTGYLDYDVVEKAVRARVGI